MNTAKVPLTQDSLVAGVYADRSIVIGEDWVLSAGITDSAGTAINITGWTFASEIRTKSGTLVATITGAITSAVGGTFTLSLSKAVTDTLTASNRLCWDVYTIDDSSEYKLRMEGAAEVRVSCTSV